MPGTTKNIIKTWLPPMRDYWHASRTHLVHDSWFHHIIVAVGLSLFRTLKAHSLMESLIWEPPLALSFTSPPFPSPLNELKCNAFQCPYTT